MLEDNGIEYTYREYRQDPLSAAEIRDVLAKLGVEPRDVLRKNDKAYKEQGLTGDESAKKLIALMAQHPTLLQRPIGVRGKQARIGRPPETLLELA
ncbi:MAG: arsenate reductase (glutaredoxin) [bacterium]|nr:arsenate reductase (glutaredoxin) [bacterium]